ncbi:MAG: hypothetical protein JRJ82_16900 [Deltaproteobacteria bacterium]|nr:hypothetical protein [Deltaproteobacteria bacterium]
MALSGGAFAYAGNILRINLSNGEVRKEPTAQGMAGFFRDCHKNPL